MACSSCLGAVRVTALHGAALLLLTAGCLQSSAAQLPSLFLGDFIVYRQMLVQAAKKIRPQ